MHRLSPSEAAKSRASSPRQEEIEAIIVEAIRPISSPGQARHRAEWDARLAVARAAEDEACLADEHDNSKEADAIATAACFRVNECARLIVQAPVHGLDDIKLLAEVLH